MTSLHFGLSTKLVQSKAPEHLSFGPGSEDAAVTRRFDDYITNTYDADEVLILKPAPNQRLVVSGEDFEPLQRELYEARQKIYFERLANFFQNAMNPMETPEARVEEAEREIAQRYLQKAEAGGKIVDLDA